MSREEDKANALFSYPCFQKACVSHISLRSRFESFTGCAESKRNPFISLVRKSASGRSLPPIRDLPVSAWREQELILAESAACQVVLKCDGPRFPRMDRPHVRSRRLFAPRMTDRLRDNWCGIIRRLPSPGLLR